MIGSLQGASQNTSLDAELDALLPRACQQLLDSQHLDSPMKSVVQPAIRQYLYDFAADPHYRHFFGPFRFPGEAWLRGHKSETPNDDGSEEDDDEEREANWTLSGAQSEAETSGLSAEYLPSRKGRACGHIFKTGESVYRCKECGLDDSCVLCVKCFKASEHEGHEVSFSMHTGGCGCCDCGDPEAWRQDVRCAFHHPDVPYPSKNSSSSTGLSGPSQSSDSAFQCIPSELQLLIRERITEALRFATFALRQFPRQTTPPRDPRSVARITTSCKRDDDSDSGMNGPWSVILWNDEKHTYQEVIETLMSSVRCSHERALEYAISVDTYGMAVVASSTDSSKVWDIARRIGQTKLGVTVCTTEDVIIMEGVGYILDWLQDLCKARMASNELFLCRMAAEVLLDNGPTSDKRGENVPQLQQLLIEEDKLWKKARSTLRGILMALLIAGQDIKLRLSSAYADVYPEIISAYLLTDREPDNSVTQFSVQLFSAPSVAIHLANQGFLIRVVQLLYAFFTQQERELHGAAIDVPSRRVLAIPPESASGPIDPESPMFKHKKYYFLFQDLQHLLFHTSVQQFVLKHENNFLPTVLDFLELFSGMNSQVRASTTHVEYENDSWVAAFNLTIHLSKLAKTVGKAFHQPCDDRESRRLFVDAIFHRTLLFLKEQLPIEDTEMRSVLLRTVPFNGKQWHVIDFQVSQQPVSFHHPIHLMYAEMLKNLGAWSPRAIASATDGLHRSYTSILASLNDDENNVALRIIDEVVRVLALLAQIRAGFWVRNGFGLRAQHLHYREYTLRETTFDLDVFFMQAAFASFDPPLLLVNIIDRFQLMQVMNLHGAQGSYDTGAVYDNAQATIVLEEFLYMLVVIFSEPTDIEGMSAEDAVRRELIHLLLMGPYSYSEILKHITDRAREETFFDRLLAQVATFRAPDPTVVSSDVGGTYILKEEYLSQIDPYYYRYTRNQREQAMKTIKEKLQNDGIFQPRKMSPQGAFAAPQFYSLMSSSNFIELLRCSLIWATHEPEQYADIVVDLSLHLIKIALTEVFDDAATGIVLSPVLSIICNLEEVDYFKDQKARIASIIDTLAKKFPDLVRNARKRKDMNMQEDTGESQASLLEKKKAAAKARQAAILQSFAAAQKSFLDSVSDDEEEEEGEENDAGTATDAMDTVDSLDDAIPADRTWQSDDHSPKRRRKVVSMGSCIVCQETLTANQPFGSLALIQTSSFIKLAQTASIYQEEMFEMPRDWDVSAEAIRPFGLAGKETSDTDNRGGTSIGFPCGSNKRGLYASACGHMMHVSCFDTYCQSIIVRHAQQFTRLHPENPERSEFVCPLCKSLGNVLLPVSEDDFEESLPPPAATVGLSDRWLRAAVESASLHNPDLTQSLSYLASDGKGRFKAWKIMGMLPQRSTIASTLALGPAERKMLERLLSVISPLEAENRMMQPDAEVKTPTIPHQLIAYTLSVVEIGLRGKATGTLDGQSIQDATSKLLRSLLASLINLVHANARTADSVQSVKTALLWLVLGQRQGDTAQHRPFLSQDPLTFLIQSAAVAPDDFYQFANLCFYAHITRISHNLCGASSEAVFAPPAASLPADATLLADLCLGLQEARWQRYGTFVQEAARQRAVNGSQHAFYHALPFLRRAALLHGVLFPAFRASTANAEESEMTRLLSILRITHPSDLLGRRHGKSAQKSSGLPAIMEAWDSAWLSSPEGKATGNGLRAVELEHPVIYELLGLPKSIDIMMESTVVRKCKRCKKVPSEPAICLICGELCCKQAYCCMEADGSYEPTYGECNTHMWKCGTSMGIFLQVKRCNLIHLYANKGMFSPAPYLDIHGEADPGFRKHRPLFLNRARYDEVRKTWLNHSVATAVARKLDSGNDYGGWITF